MQCLGGMWRIWFGTKVQLLGLLTAGVQDLETQDHHQYSIAATIAVLIKYLQATKPLALYEWVFWLQDRQAFRPQPKHSKMNQCPVELQKEQFHTRRLVSDLMLFHEVWLQLGIAKCRAVSMRAVAVFRTVIRCGLTDDCCWCGVPCQEWIVRGVRMFRVAVCNLSRSER